MKKTSKIPSFLAGMLVMALLAGLIPSAVAASGKSITIFPGVSIYLDDVKLNPTDANGNPVEAFIYNGTTYLPVRAVSEALGQVVQWDGKTHSVYIGKHSGDKPAVMLKDLDYFSGTHSNDFYTAETEKDNTGVTHANCITRSFKRTYLINGQYSRLTGTLYQTYEGRSESIAYRDMGIVIYGDGELLYACSPEEGTEGMKPQSFDIDLTGVLELRVEFDGSGYASIFASSFILSLGDVGLWT